MKKISMSVPFPGCSFYNPHKAEEKVIEDEKSSSFKEKKGPLVTKGGGLSPLLLTLSRGKSQNKPLLDQKRMKPITRWHPLLDRKDQTRINPLPHWNRLFKSLLEEDRLQKRDYEMISSTNEKSRHCLPWKTLLESFLKEKKCLLKEDIQEQALLSVIHPPYSLLERSFDVYFTSFEEEKIFTTLLSNPYPPSLMERYKKLSLERQRTHIIGKEYDEAEGKKDEPSSLLGDSLDQDFNLDFLFDENEKKQPYSLLDASLKTCFEYYSEKNLLTTILSCHSRSLFFQKYSQLFLEKRKDQLLQEIMNKGEHFYWEDIKKALLSRFPSVIKDENDIEYLISRYLIVFFKYFSPFSVKSPNVSSFLKSLIRFEESILYDLYSSRLPEFIKSFTSISSLTEIPYFLNILEKIRCTIWILALYTKAQIFCSQSAKASSGIKEHKGHFIDDRGNKRKGYFFKKLNVSFKIQKYLIRLKMETTFPIPEYVNHFYQELGHLWVKLDKLTPDRNDHLKRLEFPCFFSLRRLYWLKKKDLIQ